MSDSYSNVAAGQAASNPNFEDLNYPNELDAIPAADFNADRLNLFIAFDERRNKLSIEHRAFPLLRPPPPTNVPIPKPGFVSFIGETGSGKSWILRSLKRGEDRLRYPSPLVAPGRQHNNFASTSADVHLYADSASADSSNPILFLDFEGLMGSTVPSSLKARIENVVALPNNTESPRHGFIQDAYPRIAYAFSNCIIFVINRHARQAEYATKLLIDYANCGVEGSRHLGFKPSLFVVFNKIPNHNLSPSSWSIDETTKAFLTTPDTNDLIEHYHKIFVINIPQLTPASSDIVIEQLDKLGYLLREQHSEACNRRVAFRLDFTTDQITAYLTRALRVFTKHKNTVFDWLKQSLDQRELPDPTKIAEDIWIHFFRFFRDSCNFSPVKAFQDSLEIFQSHFIFCIRLHLTRHPPVGRTVGFIPPLFEETIHDVDRAISRYVPCIGAKDGLKCDGIQQRHDDFHSCGPNRWRGTFEPAVKYEHSLMDKVLNSLEASSQEWSKLSVRDSENVLILSKIRSVYSCVGCLNYPSTFLSCDHGFCEECVEDIAGTKDLHRLVTIECPFCRPTSEGQHFSPRFLPHTAGYRILSLDGGGVRSIAHIMILRAIEMRCFDIPTVHLFDFFIGTGIAGLLILALASRESPLTLSNVASPLTNFVAEKFKPKESLKTFIGHLWKVAVQGSTRHSTTVLEANLKSFFQESHRLLSARTPLSPHVAVTASSRTKFEKRIIPNYVRRPGADTDEDKRRLVLSAEPKQCMPTWVAARCTVGAYPQFNAFEWNGEQLVDGGFAASCPTEVAVDETRCLWPDRRMDVLVSVGTGGASCVFHVNNPSQEDHETGTRVVPNPEKLWAEFTRTHKPDIERVSRLQPVYGETIRLDAVNELEDISNGIKTWLKTNTVQIDHVGNQLIASLFFFKPSVLDRQSRTQSGSIECRLPLDLSERQTMVNALVKVAHTRQLFTVDIPGSSGEVISGALGFLEDVLPGAELTIPVTIGHLPLVGGTTIDIKLSDIFGNGESRYSISGCPFTIRE